MFWVEALGFALALLMVVCSIRELHWSWPLAIASSALYFFVFQGSQLYAQAALQIVFALVALWGWWQWLRPTHHSQKAPITQATPAAHSTLRISRMPRIGYGLSALALLVLWPTLAWLLMRYTDSPVPWADALPTALSLIAQVLLARKWIENWLLWLLVNTFSVALFAYQGLWLTCLLYTVFLGMSVWGWRQWRRQLA